MESIGVIMTVHNRKDKTLECLKRIESLITPENVAVEVYVTDDGCTDGTPEAIMKDFPHVNIVKGNGSLFWNRGMYEAWKMASKNSHDYYLWLNDDTFIYNDTLVKLYNTSKVFSDHAIILGTTCDLETRSIITYGGKKRNMEYVFDKDKPCKCIYMNGNIVLIPKYVYDIVGYNDPYYSHAMGDYDYGLTAVKKGINIYTAAGFCGECDLHDQVSTWKNPEKPLKDRWKAFFKPTGANPFEYFYYRRKHYGIFPACITFVSNFVHVLFPQFWNPDKR